MPGTDMWGMKWGVNCVGRITKILNTSCLTVQILALHETIGWCRRWGVLGLTKKRLVGWCLTEGGLAKSSKCWVGFGEEDFPVSRGFGLLAPEGSLPPGLMPGVEARCLKGTLTPSGIILVKMLPLGQGGRGPTMHRGDGVKMGKDLYHW